MSDDNNTPNKPAEDDSSKRYTIDERFNFELPASIETPSAQEPEPTKPQNDISDAKTIPSDGKLSIHIDPPEESDAMIGQKIGNYEVLSLLGRGGFGAVYKAKDSSLQRYAALKFLRSPLDSEYRRLFSREAQVIANLGKHPSIVQIYQWGEYCGNHYFALEYLDQSAEALIKQSRNPLPLKRTLEIIADCAEALQFAHENGVLHRDIKPANILIDSKTNKAKLCDFGLAKFQNMGISTEPNLVAGSPPYMSPEQISGADLDERTDIYSLGITLYEMLSGQLPFTGTNHHQIFDKIRRNNSVPLTKFRPDLPSSIHSIVTKATAQRVDDRYQSAGEMCKAIRAILDDLETSGQTRSLHRQPAAGPLPKRGIAIVAAACLVALTLFVFMSRQSPEEHETPKNSFWSPSIAEAKESIETEQYDQAVTLLQAHLAQNPSDDQAHYALGYAFLFKRDYDQAEQTFAKVSDEPLQLEGMAAVDHARNGESSREKLLEVFPTRSTPYPGVLIAQLDVGKKEYESAKTTLASINADALLFRWQQAKLNELLIRVEDAINGVSLSESILRIESEKTKLLSEEDVRKKIQNVSELAKSADREAPSKAEIWTSRRPLTFWITVPDTESSIEGLAKYLPQELSVTLEEQNTLPIALVDREYIGNTLFEQGLSSLLSGSDEDRVNLMRLRGAKFMLNTKFGRVGSNENVRLEIIDTETTDIIPFRAANIDENLSIYDLLGSLASQIVDKLQENYPLQGILTNTEDGPVINIGTAVGVEPGMTFAVFTGPDDNYLLDKVSVTIAGTPNANSALVELHDFSADSIPDTGWFVRVSQEP